MLTESLPIQGAICISFSNHPDEIKKSVASGLFLRALKICSPSYLDYKINVIKSELKS